MTGDAQSQGTAIGDNAGNPAPQPPRRGLLPGLAAIALYMVILAGITVLGVASGQIQPVYLLFSAAFIAASLGLILLLRWAWALALAAVVLMAGLFLWKFSVQHEPAFALQGLLNLVFFLYLVRTEVRARLR